MKSQPLGCCIPASQCYKSPDIDYDSDDDADSDIDDTNNDTDDDIDDSQP